MSGRGLFSRELSGGGLFGRGLSGGGLFGRELTDRGSLEIGPGVRYSTHSL